MLVYRKGMHANQRGMRVNQKGKHNGAHVGRIITLV